LEWFPILRSAEVSNIIIFTGAMDYFPNVDAVTFFVRNIFPLVRSARPNAQFLIVGSRPVSAVRRLGQLEGITVTGTVPDIRPFLAKSKVVVVPMRISQGIQNKILEAMAAGLPVVTTPAAAAGFESIIDMPIAIASDPKDIASLIVKSLQEPLSLPQVGLCRNYLRQHFDWETNFRGFDQLFRRVAGSHPLA
jgi:glycosyltransferase involved in cell wall biosynthesis